MPDPIELRRNAFLRSATAAERLRQPTGGSTIEVLFVADQPVVYEAMVAHVSRHASVASTRVCLDAATALQALRDAPLRWSLVFLDIDVPGAMGLSLAMAVKALGKAAVTCVLTGSRRADYVEAIAAAGFQGFLSKTMKTVELMQSLDDAVAGRPVFPADRGDSIPRNGLRLTRRQTECLDHVGHGLTTKAIAQRLCLHPGTVNRHIDAAMAELAVNTRAHAVQRALQLGLLQVSSR